MIAQVIDWSLRHRVLVLLASLALAAWGMLAASRSALDAIPDLAEVQVIVKTPFAGQPPQIVEDQVTYPLAATLLSVPGMRAVRGFSMFGESFIYVIFKEGTDPYWARTRVTEYLAQAAGRLPAGVAPALGPDAASTGWVFQYALVDRTGRHDTFELRALQDFFLKQELQGVPGVAEVASVGGAAKQFQVELDPNRLAAQGLSFERVADAVRAANQSGGGAVVEMGRAEYMVRAQAYVTKLADLAQVAVGQDAQGYPIRLAQVANIQFGPEARRGVTDLDGEGEATGGIVVMRYGQNALDTVAAVKVRLAELQAGLPPGVEVVTTYDRSNLIRRAIDHLQTKLLEESLAVALVCLVFLLHGRSALVALVTLPLGILVALAVMQVQGISVNLMSLGGIAIAIGAMVDAAVVMIENMHKHLERAGANVTDADRWRIARDAAVEVGPALFFSLLVITVSFLPVFALSGQEGKLFAPLAWTKTWAMAAAAGLAVTLTPVLMGWLIRGRVRRELDNPINRWLQAAYRPLLLWVLDHRRLTVAIALLLLATSAVPLMRMGSEFMPPLNEGDILYMPTTLPGILLDEAANLLQVTDRLIKTVPEVDRFFGRAGRADTATDPAPLSMLETTILLKPREQWAAGTTIDDIIRKLDSTVHLPGLTNAWGFPIRTRIDMLSTGIRTVLGVKVSGPDLAGIAAAANQVEAALRAVPGTRSVFAERGGGGRYIDIDIDRFAASRHGVSAQDLTRLVEGAIGGEIVATAIDGRARYSINVRYPRAYRDSLAALRASRITTPQGAQVTLGSLAKISVTDGPAEIRSENGRLVGYVFIDLATRDIGGYVARADAALHKLKLEPGYAYGWSGQFADLQRAKARLAWVIPATLLLVWLLLYAYFREWRKPALVLACLPFALFGGLWLCWLLGYQMSVAVAVGFIALAGVAAEFGVVMLLYIDQALAARRDETQTPALIREAVVEGAASRVRPKAMTVAVIVAGLLPIMWSLGDGADMMKRIAAPLVGGMISAPLISLFLIPALYSAWLERRNGKTAST